MNQIIHDAKILTVDDNEEHVATIEQILRRAGYRWVQSTADSRQALTLVDATAPDMLILGLQMPAPDGFAILDQLALKTIRDPWMAILVLTKDAAPSAKLKALSMGASDFLSKPIDRVDLLARTRTLLAWRFAEKHARLEKEKRLASQKLPRGREAGLDVIDRLAVIAACLDPDRAQCGERVAALSVQVASRLNLDQAFLARLGGAARLFDLGMLALPESIRNSQAPLTAEERLQMARHTQAAERMLSGTDSPMLEMAREIGLAHHERWDGSGYPNGTKGADTPLAARIVAVAHVYDALITNRPYRPALPPAEAVAEVKRQSGYAFDPHVVAAFLQVIEDSRLLPAQIEEITA